MTFHLFSQGINGCFVKTDDDDDGNKGHHYHHDEDGDNSYLTINFVFHSHPLSERFDLFELYSVRLFLKKIMFMVLECNTPKLTVH